jgi:hypothetical protein
LEQGPAEGNNARQLDADPEEENDNYEEDGPDDVAARRVTRRNDRVMLAR